MNILFGISRWYIPSFLKKRELLNLFRITASAFGQSIPVTAGLSFEECLAEFSRFTKSEVDRCIDRREDLLAIQEQLYRGAYSFGKTFRKRFRVSSAGDVMAACRLLYRVLGIDFHGTDQGNITIFTCFFSRTYSSSTCRVISSLDAGMIAGLSGGGALTFSRRLSEGSESCNARFIFNEQLQ